MQWRPGWAPLDTGSMRTITVSQPGLTRSALDLTEAGASGGRFEFHGLLKRSVRFDLGDWELTFTTTGLLGHTIRIEDAEGVLGEFRQSGILGKGEAVVDGRRYRLKRRGVLSHRFAWLDGDDTEAVRVKLGGFLRTSGTVEVADGVAPSEAAALIGLGLIAARRAADGDSGGGAAVT